MMAYVIQVSDMIAKLMRKNNYTMKELANKVGVSESAVSLWVSAKTTPRMGTIQKLADVFGVTTDEMIFGKYYDEVKEQRKIESDLEAVANDAETVFGEGTTQLLMAYYKLNAEGRNKAIDNIEDLSELYKYQKQD